MFSLNVRKHFIMEFLAVYPFILAGSGVLAGTVPFQPCLILFNPKNAEQSCCETLDAFMDEMKKCKRPSDHWTCESSMCMLNNSGFLDGNKINEKFIEESLNQMASARSELRPTALRLRQECSKGKYSTYLTPPGGCASMKFLVCFYINSLLECPSWKSDNNCNHMAEHAKNCKSALDKA